MKARRTKVGGSKQMAGLVKAGSVEGEAGGTASQALAVVARGRAAFGAMPQQQRTRLIAGLVIAATAAAGLWWWAGRTDWKTLYSGLEARDVQQVESELAAAGIEYQATIDGAGVQVPAEFVDKARMEIATKGMPQSGRMGFELFDKPNWVGSEFDEKVNYQRALEGELEHTIATIGSVRSARVHLVLPKESLFTSEQQAAKASVVLKLKRSTMGREEIASIRSLVASAVEGLTPEMVTLVDADGRVNLGEPGREAAASDEEQALAQKLIAMLEPLAGRDNVRATVNVVYDQSSVERTDEVVDPTQVVALTTQKSDQTAGGATKAGGIPGTVSNTPAAAAPGSAVAATQAAKDAQAALPVYPGAGGQGQTQHEESSTYAVTKHLTHEEQGPGRILRVSAAVLVNDRAMAGVGKDAAMVFHARTPDEMKKLAELAQAAVGFDLKRGDSVVLENISFADNVPEAKVAGVQRVSEEAQSLLRAQPDLLHMLGAGLLAVLVLLLVVRPVLKQSMMLFAAQPELGARAPVAALASGEGAVAALDQPAFEESLAAEAAVRAARRHATSLDTVGVLESVGAHIRKEPLQSTRLLEAWIGGREGTP